MCPATSGKNDGTGVDIYGLGERFRFQLKIRLSGLQEQSFLQESHERLTNFWKDTGIYIEHTDFGGRAVHGPVFGPYNSSNDGNG